MTTMQMIGVGCLVYCAACLVVGGLKPPMVWKIAKIQGFVSLLGETGAQALIIGFGLLVGAGGVYALTL